MIYSFVVMKVGMKLEVRYIRKDEFLCQKGVGAYEHPRYEKSAPFSLMQWGAMTTRAQMGPQKI